MIVAQSTTVSISLLVLAVAIFLVYLFVIVNRPEEAFVTPPLSYQYNSFGMKNLYLNTADCTAVTPFALTDVPLKYGCCNKTSCTNFAKNLDATVLGECTPLLCQLPPAMQEQLKVAGLCTTPPSGDLAALLQKRDISDLEAANAAGMLTLLIDMYEGIRATMIANQGNDIIRTCTDLAQVLGDSQIAQYYATQNVADQPAISVEQFQQICQGMSASTRDVCGQFTAAVGTCDDLVAYMKPTMPNMAALIKASFCDYGKSPSPGPSPGPACP